MPMRTIRLVREGFPKDMSLDTAVSQALLADASSGSRTETLRLTVPGRAVAFGKHDVVTPGFAEAVAAARDRGFEPFLRLSGGRAAAFHEGTVAISWTMQEERPIERIRARFAMVADLLVDAFESVGVGAGVGPVAGEYCPGEFSVHVGSAKVAGIGQRLTRSAAHIGGVIVVSGGATVQRALIPVYNALGLEWEPSTAGALSDGMEELEPDQVIDAIVGRLGEKAQIEETTLPREMVAAATAIAPRFALS